MNRHLALSLCIACGCCSGAAFADTSSGLALAGDITIDPHPFVSTATRAQVQEDLRQFRLGGINPWADDYNPVAGLHGSATRAQARAEFLAERGMVAAYAGEDSGSSYIAQASAKRRAAARQELVGQPMQVAREE